MLREEAEQRWAGQWRLQSCSVWNSLSAVLLHLYRLTSLPEKPPAIDWVYYKAAVAKAGMVDEFEKKTKSAAEYVQASKSRIVQHEKQLEKFRTMIPFDQMTFEDLNEVFPETKLDKEKYPYWPIEDLQICLKAVSGDCQSLKNLLNKVVRVTEITVQRTK
ncbi:ATP synthase subunit d, mitochondrial-like [Lepidochelys kempii]|uniref:ATP synthase subunit d, mitochondrial-like n=1 Tax=Lepidochelys kempii TaxID=8472 RepID=UPI003C6F1B0C